MTAPAIRAALERLITMASDELATPGLWAHSRASWDDAIAAARAALDAAPEGEPSDEELYDLAELFNGDPVPAMRRALELWGRPAAPPAPEPGELVAWLVVSEMVRQLRTKAATEKANRCHYSAALLTRAADLLQQDQGSVKSAPSLTIAPAPVAVPVAERLPGEGDCDAEGRCWLLTLEDEYPQWRLHSVEGHQPGGRMIWVPVDRTPGVMVDAFYVSHWLPAHALPLPAPQGGEVDG